MEENIDIFIDRSKSNAEKYHLKKKLFGTDDVIPMWVADMDLATAPQITDAITHRIKHPIFGYEEFSKKAKTSQKNWLYSKHNISIDIEDILYSPSVVTSMNIVIDTFTKEGDEVIVQTPVYPPFFKSVAKRKRKVLKNPLVLDENGTYKIDFKQLESIITSKTKLLLLCSPHNPTGRVWNKWELEKLYNICKKYDITIFEDAIHCDLVFHSNRFTSLLSLYPENSSNIIMAHGIGKTFNCAGLSISTMIVKNPMLKEMLKSNISKIHLPAPNTLSSVAFETAFSKCNIWHQELLIHLEKNIDSFINALQSYTHLIKITKPQATYLVWCDCRQMNLSDKKLREFFIKKAKLGLNPGVSFDKEGSGFMRINLAVSTKVLNQAIRQLKKALDNF